MRELCGLVARGDPPVLASCWVISGLIKGLKGFHTANPDLVGGGLLCHAVIVRQARTGQLTLYMLHYC